MGTNGTNFLVSKVVLPGELGISPGGPLGLGEPFCAKNVAFSHFFYKSDFKSCDGK